MGFGKKSLNSNGDKFGRVWGGIMKVTQVTLINFKCQQKHMVTVT